nr:cadherin-like and PC-esterase domain-containing protein 1 [Cherax quadricarinatus]
MVPRQFLREGLQGATVILKTLEASFHITALGVYTMSLHDHFHLLEHSMNLASCAHHHSCQVIDTFSMTAARYRHFLQGSVPAIFTRLCRDVRAMGRWCTM